MTTRYSIRHDLEFRYDAPVHGSVMTVFVSPVRDRRQQLCDFAIETDPGGAVFEFRGPFGNRGHFFNRPGSHECLRIRARSTVEVVPPPSLPDRLPSGSWEALRSNLGTLELWLMLQQSGFAQPSSPALERFVSAHGIEKRNDVLVSVRALRSALYQVFEYTPGSTGADSPIDHILETGRGVCQDYAHVMTSILRSWGIPARYVSGYLGPNGDPTTSIESHAWVECWLPGWGWSGFDPANDCDCDERHVRVAVGRDYADVPPVRGIFRGSAGSMLTTHVEVVRRQSSAV